jgi:hypothetical protein
MAMSVSVDYVTPVAPAVVPPAAKDEDTKVISKVTQIVNIVTKGRRT